MRRRRAFRLIRALLAVASVIAAGLIAAPQAAAEEPARLVDITLTSIKPALPTRDGTITLTGRVRNITDQRLTKLRALFWRNEAPITTREGLDQAINSDSNDPIGRRLFNQDFQDLYTADDPYLEPNQTVDFRLKVEVADLALSGDDGIFLMGVHVLQDTTNVAIGRSRIFVPMVADEPERPLKMTTIAILDSRPSMISKGLLSDDHLAEEVSSKGRLTALLDAADDQEMTFAVDPALIEELQSMRAGYQVRQPDGNRVAGTGQADAARWLDDFADLKDEHDGYRLLFGSPDLAALTHAGQRAPIRASVAAGKQVGLTSSLPLLVFPAGGAADAATMARAASLNPKAVLLADTTAKGDGPVLAGAVIRGKSTAPIISYTISAVDGGGPGPDPSNTAPQIQQRFLAETWIQATTATDDSAQGRVRVITTAAQARGDDSTVEAPWLEQSTLTELLDTVPKAWNQKFRYPAAARSAELTGGQLHSLNKLYQSYLTYADVLVDGAAVRTAGNAAVARAASSNWRRHDESRRALMIAPAGDARRHPAQQDPGQQQRPRQHRRPGGRGVPDHHSERPGRRRPGHGRQRGPARTGVQLRQPAAAVDRDHRRPDGPGSGQRDRERRGDGQGQRHRAGQGPADDRVRPDGRPAVHHRRPGDPERHDRLGDRDRRRAGARRIDGPADPSGVEGTGQVGADRRGIRVDLGTAH